MADDRIRMPQSTAGITNFSDADVSSFKILPGHVIAIIIIMILLVAAFHLLAPGILG